MKFVKKNLIRMAYASMAFWLSACGGSSPSTVSEAESVQEEEVAVELVNAPKILSVKLTEEDLFFIEWEETEGTAYQVYRKEEDSEWKPFFQTNATSMEDTSLENGVTYSYSVVSIDRSTKETLSEFSDEGESLTYYSYPEEYETNNVFDGISISWEENEKVGAYRVFRREMLTKNESELTELSVNEKDSAVTDSTESSSTESNSIENQSPEEDNAELISESDEKSVSWDAIADVKEPFFIDHEVQNDTVYQYTVACLNEDMTEVISNYLEEGVEMMFLKAPTDIIAEYTADSVNVSWEELENAEGYRVYRAEIEEPAEESLSDQTETVSDGEEPAEDTAVDTGEIYQWKAIADTSESTFEDKTVKSGESYVYTVSRINAEKEEITGYNPEGVLISFVEAPSGFAAKNEKEGIQITWKESKGAEKYRVFRKNEKNEWKAIGESKELFYLDNTVEDGSVYTYSVCCISTDGEEEISKKDEKGLNYIFLAEMPGSDLSFKNGQDGVSISWKQAKGASGYQIFRGENGKKAVKIGTVDKGDTLTYRDKTAPNGEPVTYSVLAVAKMENAEVLGTGSGSETIWLKPVKLTKMESKDVSKLYLDCDKNTGGNGYEVQYDTVSDFSKKIQIITDSSEKNTFEAENLSGVTYYARVRTYKTVGDKTYYSTWSETKNCKVKEPEKVVVQESKPEEEKHTYILNKNTGVFHYGGCRSEKAMKESNKREITETNEYMFSHYKPCGVCNPRR